MGTFFLYSPEEMFNDEFYNDIFESQGTFNDMMALIINPSPWDVILYNKHSNSIYIRKFIEYEKELESLVIGIVLQTNDDYTVDCIMKNFLTTDIQTIPLLLLFTLNNTAASAYLKDKFDRYNQKYKRITNMEFVKDISYYIPSIALLDYIWKNIDKLLDVISKIYNDEKTTEFKQGLLKGVLSVHKQKLYIWKPYENKKREIKHIVSGGMCMFLSAFTVKL